DLRHRFETSEVPAMRRQYLAALGAFEDPTLRERALEYSLSDAVRASETTTMWRDFRDRSDAQTGEFFQWIMDHYGTISHRVPPPALRFLPTLAGACSQERLAAAKAFFGDPQRSAPGVRSTLERLGDQVQQCTSLRDREERSVAEYLRSQEAR
ncbi:MAG TPA: ERAP1-like C-terminal domain-containing protein, partial [Candidatus Acidoferrales bacterium]|nr:ERAP1-like C-terminal domain-containing protein [Candidatus Acidoferrales bacterium]